MCARARLVFRQQDWGLPYTSICVIHCFCWELCARVVGGHSHTPPSLSPGGASVSHCTGSFWGGAEDDGKDPLDASQQERLKDIFREFDRVTEVRNSPNTKHRFHHQTNLSVTATMRPHKNRNLVTMHD